MRITLSPLTDHFRKDIAEGGALKVYLRTLRKWRNSAGEKILCAMDDYFTSLGCSNRNIADDYAEKKN